MRKDEYMIKTRKSMRRFLMRQKVGRKMSNSATRSAPAASSQGCTIAELAGEIGLQADEFKEWLTFSSDQVQLADGTFTHRNNVTQDTLLGENSFQIPNTMYMAWFGEGWGVGKTVMNWGVNCNDMKKLGFNVVLFDNDYYAKHIDAKYLFLNQVGSLASSKQLHGLYMMGHGGNNVLGSEGWLPTQAQTVLGPIWSVPYVGGGVGSGADSIEGRLQYHLGAVIIHACDSENANAKSLKSANGIFSGEPGTYVPIPFTPSVDPIAKHWGIEYEYLAWIIQYGGKQKTNYFHTTYYH